MFWTKMGKYTLEEYSLARKLFDETKSPRIYTYVKLAEPNKSVSESDKNSKDDFLSLLNEEGRVHYQTQFSNTDGLIIRFKKTLDDLFLEGIFTYGEPAKTISIDQPGKPSYFIGRDAELDEIKHQPAFCLL